MAEVKTVKIKRGDGFAVINESDYNPAKHILFDAPIPEPDESESEAPTKPVHTKQAHKRR